MGRLLCLGPASCIASAYCAVWERDAGIPASVEPLVVLWIRAGRCAVTIASGLVT
jgi:hypothetical protein